MTLLVVNESSRTDKLIKIKINKKCGLTNTICRPTAEDSWEAKGHHRKSGSKYKTPVESRWAKQQPRCSGPNQLKLKALNQGHHRLGHPTHLCVINSSKHSNQQRFVLETEYADCRITLSVSDNEFSKLM